MHICVARPQWVKYYCISVIAAVAMQFITGWPIKRIWRRVWYRCLQIIEFWTDQFLISWMLHRWLWNDFEFAWNSFIILFTISFSLSVLFSFSHMRDFEPHGNVSSEISSISDLAFCPQTLYFMICVILNSIHFPMLQKHYFLLSLASINVITSELYAYLTFSSGKCVFGDTFATLTLEMQLFH